MYRNTCVDCDKVFMADDLKDLVCDTCWNEQNKDEEVTIEKECECLFGCDYCLGTEPRIGRD